MKLMVQIMQACFSSVDRDILTDTQIAWFITQANGAGYEFQRYPYF